MIQNFFKLRTNQTWVLFVETNNNCVYLGIYAIATIVKSPLETESSRRVVSDGATRKPVLFLPLARVRVPSTATYCLVRFIPIVFLLNCLKHQRIITFSNTV